MVTVRFFAAARAAAGVAEEASTAPTLSDLVTELTTSRGEKLGKVLSVASFLVNGVTCHDREAPLPAGATVDVLPPFAGG